MESEGLVESCPILNSARGRRHQRPICHAIKLFMPKKRKAAQPPTVASLVKQLYDESIEDAEQEAAAHALAQTAEDDEKAKRVARALRSTEGSVEAVAALLASDGVSSEWPAAALDAAFLVENVCKCTLARAGVWRTDEIYKLCLLLVKRPRVDIDSEIAGVAAGAATWSLRMYCRVLLHGCPVLFSDARCTANRHVGGDPSRYRSRCD